MPCPYITGHPVIFLPNIEVSPEISFLVWDLTLTRKELSSENKLLCAYESYLSYAIRDLTTLFSYFTSLKI